MCITAAFEAYLAHPTSKQVCSQDDCNKLWNLAMWSTGIVLIQFSGAPYLTWGAPCQCSQAVRTTLVHALGSHVGQNVPQLSQKTLNCHSSVIQMLSFALQACMHIL